MGKYSRLFHPEASNVSNFELQRHYTTVPNQDDEGFTQQKCELYCVEAYSGKKSSECFIKQHGQNGRERNGGKPGNNNLFNDADI